MEDYPRNLAEFEARFATEEACRDYLFQLRWPEGFRCPRCGHGAAWPVRQGLWECSGCGRQTSVTAGTVFQDTRQPLRLWLRAIWWVTSQKNGVSALGLQRVLGLGSYKTAWSWLHKLRRAMVRPGRDRLSGRVEVDETYWGSPEEGVRGRQTYTKSLIAIAAQEDGRGTGRLRMRRVRDASAESLMPFVEEAIERGSTVHTDGWLGYEPLQKRGYLLTVLDFLAVLDRLGRYGILGCLGALLVHVTALLWVWLGNPISPFVSSSVLTWLSIRLDIGCAGSPSAGGQRKRIARSQLPLVKAKAGLPPCAGQRPACFGPRGGLPPLQRETIMLLTLGDHTGIGATSTTAAPATPPRSSSSPNVRRVFLALELLGFGDHPPRSAPTLPCLISELGEPAPAGLSPGVAVAPVPSPPRSRAAAARCAPVRTRSPPCSPHTTSSALRGRNPSSPAARTAVRNCG